MSGAVDAVQNERMTLLAPRRSRRVAALRCGRAACTSHVDGTAVRAKGESPQSHDRMLDEQDLDDILLDDDELDASMSSFPDRGHRRSRRDDRRFRRRVGTECIGALYSAEEEPMYKDTDYTAVHTRLASEPDDDYEHWVEETAVVLPSAEAAEKFVDDSAQAWGDCADIARVDQRRRRMVRLGTAGRRPRSRNRQSTIQEGGVDRMALSALDCRGGQRDRRGDGVWGTHPRRREVDGPRDDREGCGKVAQLPAA